MKDLQEPDAVKEWFEYDYPIMDNIPRCPSCGAEELINDNTYTASTNRNQMSQMRLPMDYQNIHATGAEGLPGVQGQAWVA